MDTTYSSEDVIDDLNESEATINDAVDHDALTSDEPEWFDFDEWFDNAPIAGFIDGYAIIQSNNGQWGRVGPDYNGYWIKPDARSVK